MFLMYFQIIYVIRIIFLGSIAIGNVPSPFDRSLALKEGQITVEWINDMYMKNPGKFTSSNSAVLLGLVKNEYKFTEIEGFKEYIEEK